MSSNTRLGWGPFFDNQVGDARGRLFARVIEAQRGGWKLAGDHDGWADVSGRFRHAVAGAGDLPAVGDWVEVKGPGSGFGVQGSGFRGSGFPDSGFPGSGSGSRAVIERRLERRSTMSRAAAGRAVAEQVIAANVDTVFAVTSANEDLNPRRLERYLTMIWEAGAVPVVLINKSDLAEDPEALAASLRERLRFVEVIPLSAMSDTATVTAALAAHLAPARTIALVGSSGVGKSTLINRLIGHDMLAVGSIRESDGRGRHTTTARQLIVLPGGALLIDTPGMRELQPWTDGDALDTAFDDVAELAQACRYEDCHHDTEPGCAMLAAIAAGTLDPDRLDNYRHLLREAAFELRKRDKSVAAELKRRWKQLSQAQKEMYRKRGDSADNRRACCYEWPPRSSGPRRF